MDFVRSYFGTNETLTSWTLLSSLFFQISADILVFFLNKIVQYFYKFFKSNKKDVTNYVMCHKKYSEYS